MSATSRTITVTPTSGSAFDISSHDIIYVIASGTGAQITANKYGAAPVVYTVTETPAAISTASQFLIAVTIDITVDPAQSTLYINADRVVDVITARTTEANIIYNAEGAANIVILVNETKASIQTAIAAIVASGGEDITTGLTAFAGGGQASATQLAWGFNEVTTVATAGDSVKLQAAQAGGKITVVNDGANSMDVFPATGDTINDGAANAAVPVAPGNEVVFIAINSTNWETSSQTIAAGNGTVSLPSFTFESDVDTGLYRIGANNLGITAAGAKVVDVATSGVGITGALDVSTNQTFAKEVNHTVSVTTTTTAATAGGNLTISSGTGATSGAGGNTTLAGGIGGLTGLGGNITISSGAGGATSGASGNTLVTTNPETGTDASGNLALTTGTSVSAASGILTIGTGAVATLGNSGAVATTTGNSTTSGDSGPITHQTGTAATGNTGLISYITGAATTGNSGNASLSTGAAATGNTGSLTLSTGNVSVAGAAGDITITAGNSLGANEGGDIAITTGNASTGSGTGGDLTIDTGTGAVNGTSGTVSGEVTITIGAAGTATTGTAGNAGRFIFTGAAGGAATGAAGIGATGTTCTLTLGNGGATSDAAGGAGGAGGGLTVTAGNGGAVTNAAVLSGIGGSISFTAGNAGAGSTAGNDGGNISFVPGNPVGTAGKRGHVILDKGFLERHSVTAAINATATATAAEVATGWITSTSGAATVITLPTGTLLGAELGAAKGTVHLLYIDNTAGANTVTIAVGADMILSTAAADSAGSFGDLTVAAGATGLGCYRIMFSSATTAVFTRIA